MDNTEWVSLFGSVAQTVAACSALLLALAAFRLQYLEFQLLLIEQSIRAILFRVALVEQYERNTWTYFAYADWKKYFEKVRILAKAHKDRFSKTAYADSADFLDSRVMLGHVLARSRSHLLRALRVAFGGTLGVTVMAIVFIPAGRLCPTHVKCSIWAAIGVLLALLFFWYWYLMGHSDKGTRGKMSFSVAT